jgi:hypothetical protein
MVIKLTIAGKSWHFRIDQLGELMETLKWNGFSVDYNLLSLPDDDVTPIDLTHYRAKFESELAELKAVL